MISKAERERLRAAASGARPGWPTFSPEVVTALLDALAEAEAAAPWQRVQNKPKRGAAVAFAVKSARQANGWTQDDLATRSGLTRTAVAQIEGGHNQASSYRVRAALAKAFGVRIDGLDALLAAHGEVAVEPTGADS